MKAKTQIRSGMMAIFLSLSALWLGACAQDPTSSSADEAPSVASAADATPTETVDDVALSEPVTLRTAFPPIDTAAQVFYGIEQGFFEELGLEFEVVSLPSGSTVQAALASGDLEIGNGSVQSIALSIGAGFDVKLIAGGALYDPEEPTSVMVVRLDSNIEEATDLEGATIGVNALGNPLHLSAQEWLTNNGANLSTIEFVELPFPQMTVALSEDRIDAAMQVEPFVTANLDSTRVLSHPYDELGDRWLISAWAARAQWIEENPNVVAAFQEGMRRASEWANANKDASAEALLSLGELDPKVVGKMNRASYTVDLDRELLQPSIDISAKYDLIDQFPAEDMLPGQ